MATKESKLITYTTRVYKLEHLNGFYLEVPADVIDHFGTFKMRVVCTVNNKLSFQTGLMALGNGNGYVNISTARLKKLGLRLKDEVTVTLKKDESKYGMPMPEELKELLAQDEEGMRRFKMLPLSKQRYILYYVNGVKNPQLRIDRAILLITNLKKTKEGKESFREMLGK
jgi:hypothetical protein